MNENPIGGYFELELPVGDGGCPLLDLGVKVNSGRHALEYILRSIGCRNIKKIWLPYFTCEVILEPVRRLNIAYDFYHVNANLEIADELEPDDGEYILANNYFGIKDDYIRRLSSRFGRRLIVDNAQAWYAQPNPGVNTFYSPRKFFGIPDGGIAITTGKQEITLRPDNSASRCSHLLKRIDSGAECGYDDFRANSEILKSEPLKSMSALTQRMLLSIDFDRSRSRRRANYEALHQKLQSTNEMKLPENKSYSCPMVYPYLTQDSSLRRRLIENKIFVAKYWPNVSEWCSGDSAEYHLAGNLLPLPIDQRYGAEEMERILSFIK